MYVRPEHRQVLTAMLDGDQQHYRAADLSGKGGKPAHWVYRRLVELEALDLVKTLPDEAEGSERSYQLTNEGRAEAVQPE